MVPKSRMLRSSLLITAASVYVVIVHGYTTSFSSRWIISRAPPLCQSSTRCSAAPVSDTGGTTLEDVEFPAPLGRVGRLKRAATFWSTAVPILASYYTRFAELKVRELSGECVDEEECQLIWDREHEAGATRLADTIASLKGFYVKTAQIIASRADLFPPQYTEALSGFTDNLDPMPASLAKAIVQQELLTRPGETFDDVFSEFDDTPLGAASVAQVHRAVLTEAYGGPREVAIKIQRPSIESKLLGDIANLKAIAKPLRKVEALPLDYYTVFSELESQLKDEFDFVAEAVAMDRIYDGLRKTQPTGELPLVLPRPVPGLVSRRVLVMDYLKGVPLSRAREEMAARGVDPDGPEAKVFGRKLLRALTEVFGRSILETGFFHADPHPGNIFVLDDGRIGLIDFGQVKQIAGRDRETLARVMVALAERERIGNSTSEADLDKIGSLALDLGVRLREGAKREAAAAVAMWLFDGSVKELPGGYDLGELSPDSPVKELESFPQDLVLVGRSSVLIKGLSSRLGIPWSLANEWAPVARGVLEGTFSTAEKDGRTRFRDVVGTLSSWGRGRASVVVRGLPGPLRRRVAAAWLRLTTPKEQS